MQSTKSTWLGLATFGVLALGCTPGANDDEVGEGNDGNTDDTNSSEDESGESTSASTTQDTSAATDDAAEESDDDAIDDASDNASEESNDTADTGNGDFQLIEAEFADDFSTLVLTFNDAVAPVDTVDPSDFRISIALTISYDYMGMSYDYSYYYDPNVLADEDAPSIDMIAIANGPAPDQLSLTLVPTFDSSACELLEMTLADTDPGAMPEGHFFPHYAPGDIPVTSEGGSELAAIGGDWVTSPELYAMVTEYGWPNLDPQIPIPCPF